AIGCIVRSVAHNDARCQRKCRAPYLVWGRAPAKSGDRCLLKVQPRPTSSLWAPTNRSAEPGRVDWKTELGRLRAEPRGRTLTIYYVYYVALRSRRPCRSGRWRAMGRDRAWLVALTRA